jgi:hypothetical protein
MNAFKLASVTVILALVLASCGGDDEGSKPVAAKSTAAPTQQAAGSSSGSESGSSDGGSSKGSSRLELQEGITTQSDADYTTANFSPRVTFHTPDLAYPFFANADQPRLLEFGSQVGGLLVLRPSKIYDPSTGSPAPLPDDLTVWATNNEHVDAGEAEQFSLGHLEGSKVDGVVTSTISKRDDCEASCIQLAPLSARDSMWFAKGDHFTLMSIHVKGDLLGIVLVSDKPGFRQLTSAATKLLKTLEFH